MTAGAAPRAAGWRNAAVLALILVLGAFLRLYALDRQSLWNDELSSYVRSHYDRIALVVEDGAATDGHPPGYLLLLYVTQRLIGHSETALRLPSALAGIVSIWLIYLLGRRLYAEREGLIAAGLMAVLWAPVFYSQEARPYAFLILLSLLTTYLWLPFLSLPRGAKMTGRQVVWYALAALAAAYCHYFGLLLVAVQGVAALMLALARREGLGRAVAAYAVVFAGYLPWLAFLRTQVGIQFAAPLPPPPLSTLVEFVQHVFFGPTYYLAAVLAVFVLALGRTVYRTARMHRPWRLDVADSWAGVLLVGWLVAPIAVAFVESWVLLPIVQVRYLLVCLPPVYLLLARAVTTLPVPDPRQMGRGRGADRRRARRPGGAARLLRPAAQTAVPRSGRVRGPTRSRLSRYPDRGERVALGLPELLLRANGIAAAHRSAGQPRGGPARAGGGAAVRGGRAMCGSSRRT